MRVPGIGCQAGVEQVAHRCRSPSAAAATSRPSSLSSRRRLVIGSRTSSSPGSAPAARSPARPTPMSAGQPIGTNGQRPRWRPQEPRQGPDSREGEQAARNGVAPRALTKASMSPCAGCRQMPAPARGGTSVDSGHPARHRNQHRLRPAAPGRNSDGLRTVIQASGPSSCRFPGRAAVLASGQLPDSASESRSRRSGIPGICASVGVHCLAVAASQAVARPRRRIRAGPPGKGFRRKNPAARGSESALAATVPENLLMSDQSALAEPAVPVESEGSASSTTWPSRWPR